MGRMLRTKLALMIAVIAAIANIASGQGASAGATTGTLRGQLGFPMSKGQPVVPESATVYILFSGILQESGSPRVGFDRDTAGGEFEYLQNNLIAKNKELKELKKKMRHQPSPEDANKFAAYCLQADDEALHSIQAWLTKHPKRGGQMIIVTPDARGLWSAENLQPGEYVVVARGRAASIDADWEASVLLHAGATITLPISHPRFFCHK